MKKEEPGHLEIAIFQQEGMLYCKISDDGIGRRKAEELKQSAVSTNKSMGLQITADRISMLPAEEKVHARITITDLVAADGSAAGTEVTLMLPICYETNNSDQ